MLRFVRESLLPKHFYSNLKPDSIEPNYIFLDTDSIKYLPLFGNLCFARWDISLDNYIFKVNISLQKPIVPLTVVGTHQPHYKIEFSYGSCKPLTMLSRLANFTFSFIL